MRFNPRNRRGRGSSIRQRKGGRDEELRSLTSSKNMNNFKYKGSDSFSENNIINWSGIMRGTSKGRTRSIRRDIASKMSGRGSLTNKNKMNLNDFYDCKKSKIDNKLVEKNDQKSIASSKKVVTTLRRQFSKPFKNKKLENLGDRNLFVQDNVFYAMEFGSYSLLVQFPKGLSEYKDSLLQTLIYCDGINFPSKYGFTFETQQEMKNAICRIQRNQDVTMKEIDEKTILHVNSNDLWRKLSLDSWKSKDSEEIKKHFNAWQVDTLMGECEELYLRLSFCSLREAKEADKLSYRDCKTEPLLFSLKNDDFRVVMPRYASLFMLSAGQPKHILKNVIKTHFEANLVLLKTSSHMILRFNSDESYESAMKTGYIELDGKYRFLEPMVVNGMLTRDEMYALRREINIMNAKKSDLMKIMEYFGATHIIANVKDKTKDGSYLAKSSSYTLLFKSALDAQYADFMVMTCENFDIYTEPIMRKRDLHSVPQRCVRRCNIPFTDYKEGASVDHLHLFLNKLKHDLSKSAKKQWNKRTKSWPPEEPADYAPEPSEILDTVKEAVKQAFGAYQMTLEDIDGNKTIYVLRFSNEEEATKAEEKVFEIGQDVLFLEKVYVNVSLYKHVPMREIHRLKKKCSMQPVIEDDDHKWGFEEDWTKPDLPFLYDIHDQDDVMPRKIDFRDNRGSKNKRFKQSKFGRRIME